MKPKLLIVTEFGFTNSKRLTRIEFSGPRGCSSSELTRATPGGPWRPTKWRVSGGNLDAGLKAYGELVFERAIMRRDTKLHGVAFSSRVAGDAEDRIMNQAYRIIDTWFACAHHRNDRLFSIRTHAFLAHFNSEFPGGLLGRACWSVQTDGLKTCRTCPGDEYAELCVGRRIRQTGRTGLGLDIPVLNGSPTILTLR
jgi:hypothetical protein